MNTTVVKVSSKGNLYLDWEPMPRVPDEYLECVVYLYPDIPSAEKGEQVGGTGCIVRIDEGGTDFYYVVTNKHVIDDGSTTVRFNTVSQRHEAFEFDERNWVRAPNTDLAILLIPDPPRNVWLRPIHPGQFIDSQKIKNLDIGIGSDVFFAGRFINAEGKDRNRPSLRFGTIAQTHTDLIDGVESFLVEARSIPGYSGSPVFSYTVAGAPRNIMSQGMPNKGYGPFLLGIDWSHINDYVDAKDANGNTLPLKIRSNSGMMGVVPAWELLDLLYRQDVMDTRERDPRRRKAATLDQAQAESDSRNATRSPNAANPNHQEDFTRLLGAAARKPLLED